jgi:hypothetical protein
MAEPFDEKDPEKFYRQLEDRFDQLQTNFERIAREYPLGIQHQSQVPHCRVREESAQDLASGSYVALTFTEEDFDLTPAGIANQHSTSADTSRLTCRVPGLYLITGSFMVSADAGGAHRLAHIRLNGGQHIGVGGNVENGFHASASVRLNASALFRLVVDDYVELLAFQDSGVSLVTVIGVEPMYPHFSFTWLSP